MRKGLRPLSVHISMAVSSMPDYFAAPELALAQSPDDLPPEIKSMLLGVHKYQRYEYERPDMLLNEVWRQGEISISTIQGHEYDPANEAVLLIPSLINKAYIFDLTEKRSMLRFLAAQNINPYLMSWGEPVNDPAQCTMDDVILNGLRPALNFVAGHEGKDIHALGYCMGGTLLAATAAQNQAHIKSLILLAAPWDFHGGSQALADRVRFWAPSAFPAIDEKGMLGVDWIQTVFASLDPAAAIRKFAGFADMKEDDERAALFVAVEDWLNDGVDLPGDVAAHCIGEWYVQNRPGRGEWTVGGQPVRPEDIEVPTLVIASDKDRLVEYETSAILVEKIKGAKLLNPSCGHIGMIAGRRSVADVWQPLADWIKA